MRAGTEPPAEEETSNVRTFGIPEAEESENEAAEYDPNY
jgi:hypothetical protein